MAHQQDIDEITRGSGVGGELVDLLDGQLIGE